MPRRTSPPRAVSSTATSRSERARICQAPPGPVQSPGSTSRSLTRTPSEVVVPTRRSARTRMWVTSLVTVLFPFVPVIETTGTRQAGAPSGRHVTVGESEGRLGDRVGPLRPDPRERHDPVPRIGRAMDDDTGPTLVVVDPQAPDPVDESVDLG